MADRTRLTGIATTGHIDLNIYLTQHIGELKRLADDHPGGFTSEVLIQRPSIDNNVAGPSA